MSRHRQSPFSTRWICISHVFLGGVLPMHPIKDCGPRRIFSKACWEKEQVEHRRNLSLQSNAGIACWLCFLPVDQKANHSKSSILLLKTPPREVYIQLVFVLSELHWTAWTFDEFVKMMMWDTREIWRKPQFIKLSMTSIRFHHSACCWTKCRCFGFSSVCCLKTWFHQIFTWGHRYLALLLPAKNLWPFGGTSNNPWLQWQGVDGGHTTGGLYRFGGKERVGDGMGLGLGKWMGWDGWVGSKS